MQVRRLACILLALCCLPAMAGPMPAKGTVEVMFTPWDDAEGALLRLIGKARQSIHVQAYLFSSRVLARALSDAHERGVRIQVLADLEQARNSDRSQVHALHDSGIPVWLEVRYANAHNKVMLVDAEQSEPVVVTGSYNYTFSAQARNAENLLILRANTPLARAYLNNWHRHRADAVPYSEAFPP
jgi:phosphatidylserine/phosphatidylglycerophosphate/cardiolipin synthase-like enzyme